MIKREPDATSSFRETPSFPSPLLLRHTVSTFQFLQLFLLGNHLPQVFPAPDYINRPAALPQQRDNDSAVFVVQPCPPIVRCTKQPRYWDPRRFAQKELQPFFVSFFFLVFRRDRFLPCLLMRVAEGSKGRENWMNGC